MRSNLGSATTPRRGFDKRGLRDRGLGNKGSANKGPGTRGAARSRVSWRRLWSGALGVLFVFGITMAGAPSCGDTAGEQVVYDVALGGSVAGGEVTRFTNGKGWEVTLDEAYVAVGPIYFFSNEALTASNGVGGGPEGLLGPWGEHVAHACPAHAQFDKGTVLGEVVEQYAVDLVSGELFQLGERSGVAGTVRMFELHLHPPGEIPAGGGGPGFDVLDGESIWVSGTATKGGVTVPFAGALTVPDEGTMRVVEQIPAEADLKEVAAGGGSLAVKVHLDGWFANVDFSSLTQQDGDGRFIIDEDSQAHVAWLSGVRSRYSYSLAVEGGAR